MLVFWTCAAQMSRTPQACWYLPHNNLAVALLMLRVQAFHVQYQSHTVLQALKQRECTVLTTLLSSSQGFVSDLATQITSYPGNDKGVRCMNPQTVA